MVPPWQCIRMHLLGRQREPPPRVSSSGAFAFRSPTTARPPDDPDPDEQVGGRQPASERLEEGERLGSER